MIYRVRTYIRHVHTARDSRKQTAYLRSRARAPDQQLGLHDVGLDEATIRQIAGLKGASKGSAADETTHFTPATDKGRLSGVGCEGFIAAPATCTAAVTNITQGHKRADR